MKVTYNNPNWGPTERWGKIALTILLAISTITSTVCLKGTLDGFLSSVFRDYRDIEWIDMTLKTIAAFVGFIISAAIDSGMKINMKLFFTDFFVWRTHADVVFNMSDARKTHAKGAFYIGLLCFIASAGTSLLGSSTASEAISPYLTAGAEGSKRNLYSRLNSASGAKADYVAYETKQIAELEKDFDALCKSTMGAKAYEDYKRGRTNGVVSFQANMTSAAKKYQEARAKLEATLAKKEAEFDQIHAKTVGAETDEMLYKQKRQQNTTRSVGFLLAAVGGLPLLIALLLIVQQSYAEYTHNVANLTNEQRERIYEAQEAAKLRQSEESRKTPAAKKKRSKSGFFASILAIFGFGSSDDDVSPL